MPQGSSGHLTIGKRQTAEGEEPRQPQRVTGWKEIATYLGRGERTVKRWEAERELPVRRVPGGGRAAVYAYRNELEDWLRSQDLREEDKAPQEPETVIPAVFAEEFPPALAPTAKDVDIEPVIESERSQVVWRWAAVAFVGVLLLFAGWTYRSRNARANEVSASERELARDLYMKGRFEWSVRTPDSLGRALDYFTQSIVHDPTNAQTYSGMADTYMLLAEYSPMPAHEAYSRARAAATKAVELDDSLAEAHRSLAFVDAWENWDFRSSEKEFERAIKLDPRDPVTHLWFATAFKWPEWRAVAEREFNRAQELDPSSPIILANKSIWLFENGRRDEGLKMARQVEAAQPEFLPARRYLATMAWDARDYPIYLAESEQMARLKHDQVLAKTMEMARRGYEDGGEKGLLKNLYEEQMILHKNGEVGGDTLAMTCLRMGKNDEAWKLLEDDFDHHRSILAILTVPDFLVFRDDPRYQRIFRGLNLPDPPAV